MLHSSLGEGIAGKVYKRMLSNGKQVAVKHIINNGHAATFVREITSLSHVRHPNLVALLGFCQCKHQRFLVYKLCHNGNLSDWLYAISMFTLEPCLSLSWKNESKLIIIKWITGRDKTPSWIQRLKIVIDNARGLWFLHIYPEGCIVHRNIKEGVFQGLRLPSKALRLWIINGYGRGSIIRKLGNEGDIWYVDPGYQRNRHVNTRGDVYSFGIMLLQLLLGQKVINLSATGPMQLNKLEKCLARSGNVNEFADHKLNGEYSVEAFDLVLRLALSCTGLKPDKSHMEQVASRLEKALDISTPSNSVSHGQASTMNHHMEGRTNIGR